AISNIAYSNENVEFDKVFIFYGAWNRKENSEGLTWFINNVYPYVNKFDLRFKVIGGGMPVEIINKLKSLKHIEYSGFVDNPYKFLTSSSALLAPLFNGAGVKVKVIEALLTGTPVIGTVVALEGLDLLRGRSDFLYKCTSAKDFINAIDNFKKKSTEERQNFKSELNYPKNKAIDLIKKFRHAND
ncbi:MAG: glycosyltransferase, partial [Flavobacterium sp.]